MLGARRGFVVVDLKSVQQPTYLASPAQAECKHRFNALVTLPHSLDNIWNAWYSPSRVSNTAEEFSQRLAVLVGGWRVPRYIGGFALEEIGYVDSVGAILGVAECQDVGALEHLVGEAEDVVHNEDGVLG